MQLVTHLSNVSLLLCLTLLILLPNLSDAGSGSDPGVKNTKLINENVYSKIFQRQREEHKHLVRHLLSMSDDYAKQYKLVKAGLLNILQHIESKRAVLIAADYKAVTDGFPRTEQLIDAVAAILENACLFADLVLHAPDKSGRILAKHKHWRALIDWALDDVVGPLANLVLDADTREVLSLYDQEVNPEKRTPDYTNPYRDIGINPDYKPAKPKRRKLDKKPQLSGGSRRNEL